MEKIQIYDENCQPTRILKDRQSVHCDGEIHGVVRIHILRKKGNVIQMLLQKRSSQCDAFPSLYDIACAGHIQNLEDSLITAMRELKEELGIEGKKEDFIFIGNRFDDWTRGTYKDKEYSYLYLYIGEIPSITLQEEEVESVKWVDVENILMCLDDTFTTYCVSKDEVSFVFDTYKKFRNL